MTAAEITTGMPQGSTSTPGRAFINSSLVALSGDPTPNDVTAPDAAKDFTGNLMDTAVPGEDFDPAGTSIPQVISFDDVASIVHERSEGQDHRREGMTLPLGGPAVDQWHLLECHFGLPLFDASLNQQVSQKIILHQLFSS
ncbi:uncharacterized protein LOC125034217 [Penaeus chinensis]|uniref:uncharacterized protein LOC125034217 n=1 Tax=Penaeus chinensis TaxID=139456 RepID=UPI001FB650DE|nr:uncharacterized protein LOC125034217 [Penaeus chinensis]